MIRALNTYRFLTCMRASAAEPRPEPEYVWRMWLRSGRGEARAYLSATDGVEQTRSVLKATGQESDLVKLERAQIGPWEVVE